MHEGWEATCKYDGDAGHVRTSLHLAHSVLPYVFLLPEFWLLLAFNVGTFLLRELGYVANYYDSDEKGFKAEDWHNVKVIAAMTIFFAVFYTQVCYTRYMELYARSKKFFDDLNLVVFELRVHMMPVAPHHARLALRFLMVATVYFVAELGLFGAVDPERMRWTSQWEGRLLNSDEHEALLRVDKDVRCSVALLWASEVFASGHLKAKGPGIILKSVLGIIHTLRKEKIELEDHAMLQMPFPYFHLLNMMVCITLGFWAYAMGACQSLFGIFVFASSEMILFGMIRLAQLLADPFGDDATDFPMGIWMQEAFDKAELLLEYDDQVVVGQKQVNARWQATLRKQGPLNISSIQDPSRASPRLPPIEEGADPPTPRSDSQPLMRDRQAVNDEETGLLQDSSAR